MSTLYERLGGEKAIDMVVDKFYDHVMADNRIRHFFSNVNMDELREHQKRFVSYAFGGPSEYSGQSLRDAHRHLVEEAGLSDEHFDAVLEALAQALRDAEVDDQLIEEAAAIVESQRNEVLNR